MLYSDLYLNEHRRPAKMLVAIALVLVSSAIGFYFFTNNSQPTRASKLSLERHEVTNLTSKQAAILWAASAEDEGSIVYGTKKNRLDLIAIDSLGKGKKKYHFAELTNLEPNTTYYYRILTTDGTLVAADGDSFSFKTAKETQVNTASPAYGTVINPDQTPADKVLVVMYVSNAYPLADVTSSSGEWLIPLQNIVNAKTLEPLTPSEQNIITINIFTSNRHSSIRALLKNTHPLPETVILGNNYSFVEGNEVLGAVTGAPTQSPISPAIQLTFPVDNSVIPGKRPLVKGTGIAGAFVSTTIDGPMHLSGSVVVNKEGEWQYSVPHDLVPGKYAFTMVTQNEEGNNVVVKRTFTIIKSGEQVLGESTPSGTLAPSLSSAPSGTITPDLSTTPTSEPTIIVINPLATDTPGAATTTPAPPVSGIDSIPWMMMGFGITIVGAGLVILL
ncbi:fibronectin type III domain-containing protein [Candidatus Woesebacteria bacterium]|nr:fibronectin type III domain-containing protein [Candidatus Woesebacteria bacterium]